MGNAPSSRSSTPPPEPPQPPRVPPRAYSPPPRDALALKRGQSLVSMAQPVAATSFPPPASPTPRRPAQPQALPELDVGEAMPGELEEPAEDQSTDLTDWRATRAALERALGPLRDRAEEITRDTRERRQGRRAIEEEVPVHERKMTIYEDAEPGSLDELRFPPGLERGDSETEVSAFSHSSEPTSETLVEEPDEATEEPAEIPPKMVVEKLEAHEFPEVDSISREEPGTVKELAVIPEKPEFGLESSQVSSEEPEQDVLAFEEAQPSQEVAPILQDTQPSQETAPILPDTQPSQEAAPIFQEIPLVSEEHPIDQSPFISSDLLSSLEESSDAQSEHLSSSFEFPRPNTPHPTFDDARVASPVPFPATNDHEDQGYGTQDDEDRATQAAQRSPGKHVHWGGVEAQPAYERAQDEEEQVEEHSPPFSRLLLPASQPAEPLQDVRPERATRLAARRTVPPALQKPMRKFEQGVYTMTDVRWGMALDLSSADNRSPVAFGSHGWEQQQWEFHPCGAGFTIKNVGSGSFLVLEDLQGIHLESSVEVVTGDFPTCWEMEVMDNGSAEDGEGENEDVYARIRLPRSEMALGFKGGYAGAQLLLTKDANNMSTYWRLRVPRREQVVKNPPISTTETVRHGGVTSLITTTTVTMTTTRTVTQIMTDDA